MHRPSDSRGDIGVANRVSAAGKRLPATGPAAGTFRPGWTAKADLGGEQAVLDRRAKLIGGRLVVRLPGGLQAYDAPLPLPVYGGEEPMPLAQSAIGAGGDQLIAWKQHTADTSPDGIQSFRRSPGQEPYELGGVRPDEWPDPCKLLAGVRKDPGPKASRPLRIGEVDVPRTRCTASLEGSRLVVDVIWGAANAEEADRLVDGERMDLGTIPPIDEVVRGRGSETIRIGRWIIQIGTFTTIGDDLYRSIAKNLPKDR